MKFIENIIDTITGNEIYYGIFVFLGVFLLFGSIAAVIYYSMKACQDPNQVYDEEEYLTSDEWVEKETARIMNKIGKDLFEVNSKYHELRYGTEIKTHNSE